MLRRLLFCNRPIRTFIIIVDIAAWTQNVDVDLCVHPSCKTNSNHK